jgi:hypothetical protein
MSLVSPHKENASNGCTLDPVTGPVKEMGALGFVSLHETTLKNQKISS